MREGSEVAFVLLTVRAAVGAWRMVDLRSEMSGKVVSHAWKRRVSTRLVWTAGLGTPGTWPLYVPNWIDVRPLAGAGGEWTLSVGLCCGVMLAVPVSAPAEVPK